MGSSKRHKERDHDHDHKKKRKHKSRSRSRSTSRERVKKKREGKKTRYDYDHGNAVPVNEDYPEESGAASSQDAESLSIAETNRLRASLGLKPLEVDTEPIKDEGLEPGELATIDGDVHKPAVNISDLKKTEAFKEKMEQIREKRRLNKKLGKVKTLGESDDDEDDGALAWIKKSRKLEKEKAKANQRAKLLEEMDAEFGIGDLVADEFKSSAKQEYKSKDLSGLTVEHSTESFKEGRSVILTLKDQGVLDEGEESLVNVNIIDDERYSKNIELKKKKPDYKAYDDEDPDQYGMFKMPKVLSKYDEEIEGERKSKFSLTGGQYDASEEARMEKIRKQLKQQSQTLQSAPLSLASEFFTSDEMAAKKQKFKKVRKKVRKIKTVKADDLLPLGADEQEDHGSRTGIKIETEPVFSSDTLKMETDEPTDDLGPVQEESELELQLALNKSRKLRLKKETNPFTNPEKIAERLRKLPDVRDIKQEADSDSDQGMDLDTNDDTMILNSTSEFCRTLGDIPTYGLAGNRVEERDELLDFELELLQERKRRELEAEEQSGWAAVEIDSTPVDIQPGDDTGTGLDLEPAVSSGVVAALSLASKKGFLEGGEKKLNLNKALPDLAAQHYSIEDKRLDDDDKYKRRERYIGGAMDFKDKHNYKPDIKIEYADDSGRILGPKEAFKHLSYRFHGKGSGKKKTEKRLKKIEEEKLMKQMSSTDTPLSTVTLFREKQRSEKSPFIVLSGGQKTSMTSITK